MYASPFIHILTNVFNVSTPTTCFVLFFAGVFQIKSPTLSNVTCIFLNMTLSQRETTLHIHNTILIPSEITPGSSNTQAIIKCLPLFQIWSLQSFVWIRIQERATDWIWYVSPTLLIHNNSLLPLFYAICWKKNLNNLYWSIHFQILYLIISLWYCLTCSFTSYTSCKLGLDLEAW